MSRIIKSQDGQVRIDSNLEITGDLSVFGDTTTLNVQNLLVEDTKILLGSQNTSDSIDLGLIVQRGGPNGAFFWDSSASEFAVALTTDNASTSDDIIISQYANFRCANLQAATITGTVSGYLALTGGTMTGFITLHADPTANLHAATKQYVDTVVGGVDTSKANASLILTAGDGLTGGGDLTENRTFTLGTPSTLTPLTSNDVSASSHTHEITGFAELTGATFTGDVSAPSFNTTSSARYKEDIQDLDLEVDLKPVQWRWKDGMFRKGLDFGFIAEDIYKKYPQLVSVNSQGQVESLDYGRITALLALKIQQLEKKIDELTKDR